MEEAIVLYASADHLNTISVLAKFISKHHPSFSVIIISTAASTSVGPTVPSITYHRLLSTHTLSRDSTAKSAAEFNFESTRLNNPNLHDALQEISRKSKIKAFILDFFCNPAFEVSTSLNIPTYFDLSCGAHYLCYVMHLPTIHETIPGSIGELNDFVDVPGCPPIYSLDFPQSTFLRSSISYKQYVATGINMRKSNGIIVNSFDALEFRAKEALSNGLCVPNAPTPPIYFVGPLIDDDNNNSVAVEHECMRWLDSQPSKSVIFLCFGRRGLFSDEQLKEMALGLENSGYRFLWSVRGRNLASGEEPDLDELLPEGFLERTKDRGFVIKSWAPQKEVLSHDSVGGFVTHCGRTSILEALSYGVPMIGWPMYAEQRFNRVIMVEEMKVGLPLEEGEDGFVSAAELEKRVRELMDTKIVRAIKHRVTEIKIATEAAMKKNGSSVNALEKFIESLTGD